jgi:hypothetical protein
MRQAHGREQRGLVDTARSSIGIARFGRMFRWLLPAVHTDSGLADLAASLIQGEFPKIRAENEALKQAGKTLKKLDVPITTSEPEDENPTIPAGYTYLGQFIDHDLTFDPISTLEKQNDPNALEDFRTARFDLDSVYGRGPDDQPYMYDPSTGTLLLGHDKMPPSLTHSRFDLPRNALETAIVGDPRNDENRIVSQLQTLMMSFHNKIITTHPDIKGIKNPSERFVRTQQWVRWHYQWIVLHDYLPKIVGAETATVVLTSCADFGTHKIT